VAAAQQSKNPKKAKATLLPLRNPKAVLKSHLPPNLPAAKNPKRRNEVGYDLF
jgi:hypothetical protein